MKKILLILVCSLVLFGCENVSEEPEIIEDTVAEETFEPTMECSEDLERFVLFVSEHDGASSLGDFVEVGKESFWEILSDLPKFWKTEYEKRKVGAKPFLAWEKSTKKLKKAFTEYEQEIRDEKHFVDPNFRQDALRYIQREYELQDAVIDFTGHVAYLFLREEIMSEAELVEYEREMEVANKILERLSVESTKSFEAMVQKHCHPIEN